jgi:hypothetical protein
VPVDVLPTGDNLLVADDEPGRASERVKNPVVDPHHVRRGHNPDVALVGILGVRTDDGARAHGNVALGGDPSFGCPSFNLDQALLGGHLLVASHDF